MTRRPRVATIAAIGALLLGACSRTPAPASAPPVASEPLDADGPAEGGAVGSATQDTLPEAEIDAAVKDAIASRSVPGAVVVIGRHDRVLFRRAYGFRQLEPDRVPMTFDTVFDLASLTKPLATATSLMVLVERGAVALDDPLVKYVPECGSKGKSAITLRHLLLHISGLPADISKESFALGRNEALRRICDVTLRGPPGTVSIYSDLGFVLLEEVIRRVTARELPAFAEETIFVPLGMRDTMFQPTDDLKRRAAWTENVDGVWRVGVVHDPRAYLLGGVAGHAGLFSTADDVAIYARAILGGGEVGGARILSRRTVATMTAPYDLPGTIRALGWAVESGWRGEGWSPRAIGHLGYTGTALWIDPEKDLFAVVLTNRVHPDGKGDSKPLLARINTLAAGAIGPQVGRVVCAGDESGARSNAGARLASNAGLGAGREAGVLDARLGEAVGAGVALGESVRAGIDVLRDEGFERLRGLRLGLITNASGRARDGTPTVDLLMNAPGVNLVALFSPEHGLDATGSGRIGDARDARTGLPVYSLYGEALSPSDDSLAGIDALVFDVQDVGTRFFTYGSTMQRALVAAAEHDLRFIVLDRPDPIDGVDVDGPVLVPPSGSFVNYHSLPIRHGMTMGELATLLNADDHLGVALSVVTMRGWRRASYGDETGLSWVNPSPNLRSVGEALLYPAVGLLESTNLSVGRGTDAPFEHLGAPWIDAKALAAALAAEDLPGVAIQPEIFTPTDDRYAGHACSGVHLTITERSRFPAVRTGLAIARALRRLYPRTWEFAKLDRLLVHPDTMRAIDRGAPLEAIVATYQGELTAFAAKREKYLLYRDRDCVTGVGLTREGGATRDGGLGGSSEAAGFVDAGGPPR
jgi:uncharacterized protein YbbC (DUF1343 family)/CubicO group peptidase (beta-lactamase class C family)